MVGSTFQCHLWAGVNERYFHENTVVLEALNRSQGEPLRNSSSIAGAADIRSGHVDLQHWANQFLDDFALVSAGEGGASNVSACCLEHDASSSSSFVIRVARNENFGQEMLSRMQRIVELLNTVRSRPESEKLEIQAELLDVVVECCRKRMRNHVDGPKGLKALLDSVNMNVAETKKGTGQDEEHERAVRIYQDIVATARQTSDEASRLRRLAHLAYEVRRSDRFRKVLQDHNRFGSHQHVKIIEKLGKLARFYRSAVTFVRVGRTGLHFAMESIKSLVRRVDAISSSSINSLKQRLPVLNNTNKLQLQEVKRLLNRYNNYVVHAEVLLLLHYESHDEASLVTEYIGISKRSCFLCANFIRCHSRFAVEGSHQQLYSLWTLPTRLEVRDRARQQRLTEALKALNCIVAAKIQGLRRSGYAKFMYNAESVANFSRISFTSPPDGHGTEDEKLTSQEIELALSLDRLQISNVREVSATQLPVISELSNHSFGVNAGQGRGSLKTVEEEIVEEEAVEEEAVEEEAVEEEAVEEERPATDLNHETGSIEDQNQQDKNVGPVDILIPRASSFKSVSRSAVLRPSQSLGPHQYDLEKDSPTRTRAQFIGQSVRPDRRRSKNYSPSARKYRSHSSKSYNHGSPKSKSKAGIAMRPVWRRALLKIGRILGIHRPRMRRYRYTNQ